MAIKKTNVKKTRYLNPKFLQQFKLSLWKCRAYAIKVIGNESLHSYIRNEFKKIEKKLQDIDYNTHWGKMDNYGRGNK